MPKINFLFLFLFFFGIAGPWAISPNRPASLFGPGMARSELIVSNSSDFIFFSLI